MPSNYNNNGGGGGGGRLGRGRYRGGRGRGRGSGGGGEQRQPHTEPAPPAVTKESAMVEAVAEDDNICVLCAHEVKIYALGKCDHPVCYRCSMKIRMLCEEIICPVCRTELNKIILSSELKPFKQLLSEGKLIRERKNDAGFFFCSDMVGDKFYEVLEFRCPKCPDRLPDVTFEETKAHLRKEHQLQYCDICATHNKQFPFEYKCYNRQDLATHRRKGDEDDTSHRGHPMCESCQVRYLDQDILYQHLRKDHFFCHICDSISDVNQDLRGKMNFYDSYNELNEHYREAHYLCQEGECASAQYTNVFPSKIDFQAHIVSKHGGGRTRAQQRMDRTIDINLHYSNRPSSSSLGGGFNRDSDRGSGGRGGGARGGRGERGGGSRGGRGERGRGRHRESRNAVGAFERHGEHDMQMIRAMQASRHEHELNTAKEEAAAVEASQPHSILEDVESFPILAVTSSSSTSSVAPSTTSMPGATVPDAIKQSRTTEKPKEKAAPAAAASSKASRNTGTGLISKWNQTLTSGSLDTDFPALSTRAAPSPFLTPAVTASAVTRQDSSKKVPQKKGSSAAACLRPPKPADFPSLAGNGHYDPKKSLAPQWKKAKGGKSGLSSSAQRIFAHQNSFAALSNHSTNGGGGGGKVSTASTSVGGGGGKSGNSKKKKKARDDYGDDDVGGYTMVTRNLISQESFQPKVEANVKMIEAKPEVASERPRQNPREFADSPFDFPSLGGVSGAVAPPPGFGSSAPRYKSPFGGATTTTSGSNGKGRGSKVMKPPPGFSNLAATAAPITTVVLTSSDDDEVVKPPPPVPVSSDFPALAPGASAFPGLPAPSRSRRKRSKAPVANVSRWGGASNGGGSAQQQGPSLVESLRDVNIGSGKGKLNLGNMFDYEI